MHRNSAEDALLSKQINSHKAEIKNLKSSKEKLEQKIKDLLFREDPNKGIFHAQEIYRLKQDKLCLQVEIDIQEKKLKRLLVEN